MAKRKSKSTARRWWQYERRSEELASRSIYVKRILGALSMALGVILLSLCLGVVGYHFVAGFNWIDSLLEASMILGGMGPVNELRGDSAKLFASLYALFSGLVVIALMGIMLSPVVHRVMHQFHVDEKDID
jgi:hypothetical protein